MENSLYKIKKSTLLIAINIMIVFTSLGFDLPIPPTQEKTTLFTFKEFERIPKIPYNLYQEMIKTGKKQKYIWNATDSLHKATELAYKGDYEHALNIFIQLEIDTVSNEFIIGLYQKTLQSTLRYSLLQKSFANEANKFQEKKEINKIRQNILDARALNDSRIWNFEHDRVLRVIEDTIIKKNEAIEIAKLIDAALRHEVQYNDEYDPILAQAYLEFGDFLMNNLHISNAYIAYNIARNFNKKSNIISEKIKLSKQKLDDNNYLLPSYTSIFPKLRNIDQRDTVKIFIQKSTENIDTLNTIKEDNKESEEKYTNKDLIPWLQTEELIIITLFLLLIFIVIFIKTDK